MKLLTDQQILDRFDQLNRPGRQIRNLADSHGPGITAQKSQKMTSSFVERGTGTMAERVKRSIKVAKRIASTK